MGWCGSELAQQVWDIIKEYIPEKDKKKVAKKIVNAFEDYDGDDWDETQEVARLAHPEWFTEGQ